MQSDNHSKCKVIALVEGPGYGRGQVTALRGVEHMWKGMIT